MTTVSGAEFATLIHDTALTATLAEPILIQTIDLIKLYGGEDVSINNLSGTIGSKTATVTEKQRGAIYMAARAIYASFYKNSATKTVSLSGINISSQVDLMSNPAVLASIKEAAELLRETDYSRAFI
jgi:hypothetical protein